MTIEWILESDLQRLYNHWLILESNNRWHVLEDFVPRMKRFYLHHISRIKDEKQAKMTSYRKKVQENSQLRFSFMILSRHYLSMIRKLEQECAKLEQLERELQDQADIMQERIEVNFEMQSMIRLFENQITASGHSSQRAVQHRSKGLSLETIQKFDQFQAEELVSGECGVCLENIQVGMTMIRLDCKGGHVFCKDCIEKWFADHKTCPNCRFYF